MELAIEVGAEDVTEDSSEPSESDEGEEGTHTDAELVEEMKQADDKCFQFLCEPGDLKAVSDAIKTQPFTISSASLEYIPKTFIELDGREYKRALRTVSLLSEQDDVVEVYDNFVLKKEGE